MIQAQVLLAVGLLLLMVNPVQAVIISEVYPQPNSEETEWIELYNPDDSIISVEGWQIFDQLSSSSLLITLSGSLEPLAYLQINFSGSKLNNSGDGVTLFDQDGQIKDEMSYSSSQAGLSWALISASWQIAPATPNAANQLEPSPSPSSSPIPPTPTTPVIPSNSPDLSSIALTEIMACPVQNQSEWIEFYNSSNGEIELSDWQVKDSKDHSIKINLKLMPHAYQIFEWSYSLLNNTGDEVWLLTDQGVLLNHVRLANCQTGQSWQLQDEIWYLDEPTPNQANQKSFTSPTAAPSATPTQADFPSPSPILLPTSFFISSTAPPQLPKNNWPDLTINKIASLSGITNNLADPVDGEQTKPPLESSLSVIMGGLFFQIAGSIKWYAKKFKPINTRVA